MTYKLMKQIIQDLKNGQTILETVPAPQVRNGHVLIKTRQSLVSLGTERSLVEFGKASLIEKARQQPDKVKLVLDKIKSDGLLPTLEAVFTKLGQPLPLGYCNTGTVIACGSGVQGFRAGDRVASNGPHAEFVVVPQNLAAKIPDNVTDPEACFTVIGSIGLQGIRLLQPTYGETIVVIGLGLIGLVTAELLVANGCNVIGFDYDQTKIDIAMQKGISAISPGQGLDPVRFVESQTQGNGADGVIIAAATNDKKVISQAAQMSRKRGRIILVGVVGLNLSRNDFYEKELTFQVSCSYGPGRYDSKYEQKGHDYPLGFVRWTEKRNFETILHSISTGRLDVKPLITEKVPLKDFNKIYGNLGGTTAIASLLVYNDKACPDSVVKLSQPAFTAASGSSAIGIIGAGNFTSATLLPAIKGLDANIKYIASSSGLSAKILAEKGGFANATSDYTLILEDQNVDTVIITTRHDLHAPMVIESLHSGKNIFVEKPLCLNETELTAIISAAQKNNKNVTVGFNRRFAPLALKIKQLLGNDAMNIVATMNAGAIPRDSWVHDMQTGGGRIIGEACHFIDLCTYFTGSRVTAVCMNALGVTPEESTDNASILLRYENGANAVVNYFSNGNKTYPKERIEIFSLDRTLIMDNWLHLKGYGFKNFSKMKSKSDKGHHNQFKALMRFIRDGGQPLIPFSEIINTTRASFACIASLKTGTWVDVR
ncbi:MAG: bi-domain-containing oxidoreductase [Desulfobacteraceae bacterium]